MDQPALVPRERWELAQATLASRARESGSNQKRHALAGLLRCSACGATLKAMVNRPIRNGKRYEYWHYSCKVYNSGCSEGYSISERRALAELAEHVNDRLRATEQWVQPEAATSIGEVEDGIVALREVLADAERKVRKAHRAFVDADDEDMTAIALEELHRRREIVRRLRFELTEARESYAAAMTAPAEKLDVEALRDLLMAWEEFPANEKRAVLETVIDHAVLMPPGRARRLELHWAGEAIGGGGEAGGAVAPRTADGRETGCFHCLRDGLREAPRCRAPLCGRTLRARSHRVLGYELHSVLRQTVAG